MITKITSGGRSYDLDLASGRLFRERDEVVPLSARQWELLCYFVNNPNRLLSKDELMKAVWGATALF